MALSNWATMAFDSEGKPCDGTIKGFGSASAEIYKNWLYIYSEKMWAEGDSFTQPCIAQIDEGRLCIGKLEIEASRGPQDAIFVSITSTDYTADPCETIRMAGIGCCGYSDPLDGLIKHFGVNKDEYEDISYFTEYRGDNPAQLVLACFKLDDDTVIEYKITEAEAESLGLTSTWVGVTEETFNEFFAWLELLDCTYDDQLAKWIQTIKDSKHLQFNQGDAYFAEHGITFGDEVMTEEPHEPVINKLLDI